MLRSTYRVGRRLLTVAFLALPALAGAATAEAAATRAEPLRDLAPSRTANLFRDRLLDRGVVARASRSPFRAYPTADGSAVRVSMSDAYGEDEAAARTYVDFLSRLPHGAELGRLRVYVAPPNEVTRSCGGVRGVLACYSPREQLMIVPGEETLSRTGVSASYVVTHEYGHHIAANRDNDPFAAIDLGPKYWASYERVCYFVQRNRLAPGDQGGRYDENPGEGWAEAYARLKYPEQAWTFTRLLEPDAGALAAARRDVLEPWTRGRVRSFDGSFASGGSDVRSYRVAANLDGPFDVRLKGPRRAEYDLLVSVNGVTQERTRRAGSNDSIRGRALCRRARTETVAIRVARRSGRGAFRLTVSDAG